MVVAAVVGPCEGECGGETGSCGAGDDWRATAEEAMVAAVARSLMEAIGKKRQKKIGA